MRKWSNIIISSLSLLSLSLNNSAIIIWGQFACDTQLNDRPKFIAFDESISWVFVCFPFIFFLVYFGRWITKIWHMFTLRRHRKEKMIEKLVLRSFACRQSWINLFRVCRLDRLNTNKKRKTKSKTKRVLTTGQYLFVRSPHQLPRFSVALLLSRLIQRRTKKRFFQLSISKANRFVHIQQHIHRAQRIKQKNQQNCLFRPTENATVKRPMPNQPNLHCPSNFSRRKANETKRRPRKWRLWIERCRCVCSLTLFTH